METFLLRLAQILGKIILSGEIVDARAGFMDVPKSIRSQGIQTHRFGFTETITPILAPMVATKESHHISALHALP